MPLARQSSLPRSRQSPAAYGGVACADGENDVEKHFTALELLVSLGWRTIGAKQNEISSIQFNWARKVRGKVKQNLFWAAIHNVITILVAAGVLNPLFRVLLRPEWSALAMNASTLTVTLNALLLNRAPWRNEPLPTQSLVDARLQR
jgi:hypothetical protein